MANPTMATLRVPYNALNYPNYLDTVSFDYASMIDQIGRMEPYSTPMSVDDLGSYCPNEIRAVERWASYKSAKNPVAMLHMVTVFHRLVTMLGRVPTQAEFRDGYFEMASYQISAFSALKEKDGLDPEKIRYCIAMRCDRSYPSFLRDLEFALLLRAVGMNVVYNEMLDTMMNTDIMYTSGSGRHYAIHLYTKTSKAEEYRARKDFRHSSKFDNVIDVDYEMDLTRTALNGYKLYDMSDVNGLVDAMRNEKSKYTA